MNKEQLRAQAQRAATRRREEAANPRPEGAKKLALVGKTTQLTVTIQRGQYDRLKAWPEAMKVPQQLGRVSIPTVEVMRALIDELVESEELSERIARRLLDSLS